MTKRMTLFVAQVAVLGLALPTAALAGPLYPGDFKDVAKLKALGDKVGAQAVLIDNPCVAPAADAKPCAKTALHTVLSRLKAKKRARILQLGDSHIAADYITGLIRHRLQAKYGDGGRGFMHIDQRFGFGGRKTARKDSEWTQTRVVDKHGPGKPFGFSGMSLESKKKGASVAYRILPGDELLRVYYQQRPGGAGVEVQLEGKKIGRFDTAGAAESKVFELALPAPEGAPPDQKKGPPGWTLELVAQGKGAQLFGLALEKAGDTGLIYESVGPVGADAKLYLETGRDSFVQHLQAHKPDLIVLMVGGNDALKSRKKWTDLDKVKRDHEQLVDLLKKTLPEVEVLIWAPMDAGDKKGKVVTSKPLLGEVRDLQKAVAAAKGVAFWDTLEAMGGLGSITRWNAANVMNKDLVHPKKRAADLLGQLFADAVLAL